MTCKWIRHRGRTLEAVGTFVKSFLNPRKIWQTGTEISRRWRWFTPHSGYKWRLVEPGEIKRRIEAARVLRGISQPEMDRLGADLGLPKQELSRTERGELPWSQARAMILQRVLGVPDRWFTEPKVDALVGLTAPEDLTPEAMRGLLERLIAGLDQAEGQAQRENN